MKRSYLVPLAAVALTAAFLAVSSGCDRVDAARKKDIIAYVNKDPIFLSDLKREIELRLKLNPGFKITPESESEQMDIIIDRKLIIQEAMKRGLAKQDRFVNTIKTFWEQTLIRDFIDDKKFEFKSKLSVAESDIRDYYSHLTDQVTFKVLRTKNKRYVDDAYDQILKNKNTDFVPWQVVGPAGYEDIGVGVLLDAFDLPVDEVRKFEEPPDYFMVMVIARDKKEVEPLETLRPAIEKRASDLKERRLFDDWLRQERKKANIQFIPQ